MLFYSNTDDHSRCNLGFSILPKATWIIGDSGSGRLSLTTLPPDGRWWADMKPKWTFMNKVVWCAGFRGARHKNLALDVSWMDWSLQVPASLFITHADMMYKSIPKEGRRGIILLLDPLMDKPYPVSLGTEWHFKWMKWNWIPNFVL